MSPKPPTSSPLPSAGTPNVDARAANQVPRAVTALARSDAAGVVIEAHRHSRDQFIYAIRGVMSIEAKGCLWTIPSSHGMWMPAEVTHKIRMDTPVEMRTLYFQRGIVQTLGSDCCVLAVTPLLRELILRAMSIRPRYARGTAEERLMQVVADEMGLLERQPLSLQMPSDRRLARLCQLMIQHMSDSASIAELGARVGLSERSVIRLFPKETGLSLHRWRQQARLMHAFVLAEQGMSVTQVAFELGYSSSSAFSKMLRKQFGGAPRQVLNRYDGAAG